MSKFDKELSLKELASVADKDIDFSDIPELDVNFWKNAEQVTIDKTESITLRVKTSVLKHFREDGKGYQTRINRVLESYVNSTHREP